MIDLVNLKNTMKLMIVSMNDEIMEMLRGMVFNSYSDSYEAGEAVDDREIKKLQKMWNRGYVCPICGNQECEAAFSSPSEVSGDGGVIKPDSVVEDMLGGKVGPTTMLTTGTVREGCSFETRDEFDKHMRSVHNVCVEDALDELPEEALLKEYGAHYYNFKHDHNIVCKDEGKHVKVKPHHHNYKISEDYYEGKSIKVDNTEK